MCNNTPAERTLLQRIEFSIPVFESYNRELLNGELTLEGLELRVKYHFGAIFLTDVDKQINFFGLHGDAAIEALISGSVGSYHDALIDIDDVIPVLCMTLEQWRDQLTAQEVAA